MNREAASGLLQTKAAPALPSRVLYILYSDAVACHRIRFGRRAAGCSCQAAGDDFGINYSDIAPLTDAQLAQFRRAPKVLVAARIDKEVYDWLMKYGKGYSTRINGILRRVMEGTR